MQAPPIDTLIASETIQQRVSQLGRQLREDCGPEPLHFIGILKGAVLFLADLVRAVPGAVTLDFMALSSYGSSTRTSGEVKLVKDLDSAIEGRDVIVVEDIVDTGLTLHYLRDILRARGPRSLRTVCLLDKPTRRRVSVKVDYVGFSIQDHFVVGYGLDLDGLHRNLPFIGVVRSSND